VTGERSFSEVLQDIGRNLQEIVGSEVRLAKVEVRAEAAQAASSALWLGTGVVGAVGASMFLLWAAAYGLAAIMPMWGATLTVAAVTGGLAGLSILKGVRHFKRIQPVPERTVETLKENLEWMKQSGN
jgi:hypothetical protein